MIMLIN